MPEDTPKTPEHEGTTAPSSRKLKVVALLVGAPSVAILFRLLYRAIYSDVFLDGPRWYVVASIAVFGAVVGFPLSYALYNATKIWKGPTLSDLRRAPFIAAYWSVVGSIFISPRLSPLWDHAPEYVDPMEDLLLSLIFVLVTYFVVKKVMVSWLEMPALKDSGLSIARKRILWRLYCLFLAVALSNEALMEILEPSSIGFTQNSTLTIWLELLVPIALVVICYRVGLRVLNLNRG